MENTNIESFIRNRSWEYFKVGDIYCIIKNQVLGYQANSGDTVTFWYKGYTLDGRVFDTNIIGEAKKAKLDTLIHSFEPITVVVGKGTLVKGLDDGLRLLHEGEVATVLFPSSLGFKGNIVGPIPQWSPLGYDIEVVRVNGKGIQKEKLFIEGLKLIENGYSADTTGLYFKFLTLGSIPSQPIGDTVYGWYKGILPDGTLIKDLGEGSHQIVLSSEDMPVGLKYGFRLSKLGSLTELIIPSFLGFGNEGYGIVGPYQTTFYQIRLDSIN